MLNTHELPQMRTPEGPVYALSLGAWERKAGFALVLLTSVVAVIWLTFVSTAQAGYEPVGVFAESGEGSLGGGPSGLAVNDTTGEVYEADQAESRVLRFDSRGNFLADWGWGVASGAREYQRCGPAEALNTVCNEGEGGGQFGEGAGELADPDAIAVDPVTGDVYVEAAGRQNGVVQVFSDEGEIIGSFGEKGTGSPEKIQSPGGGIAVDASGDVYLIDSGEASGYGPRVMEFRPESPGDYKSYVYAGRSHDLFVGAHSSSANSLAVDSHGDFYLAGGERVYRFEASDLANPTWERRFPSLRGLAVDPTSGDAFVYSYGEKKYNKLDSDNGETLEVFPVTEGSNGESVAIGGAVFNPSMVWDAGSPAGVLYTDIGANSDTGRRAHGIIFAQPPVFPPTIVAESVSAVGSTSVSLVAQVNPNGYETRYHFEYGSEDCSMGGCVEAPVGGGDLGAGQESLTASVTLSGLHSGSTYHYRVTATNQFGTSRGEDGVFTTFASSAGLPDGRVYEMVSPAFKQGEDVFPPGGEYGPCQCEPGEPNPKAPMQSAPDGDSVVYEGFPFSLQGGAVGENEYLSTRTATGWHTRDLSPTLMNRGSGRYWAFSSDLLHGMLEQGSPSLAPDVPAEYEDLYLQDDQGGGLQPLLTSVPSNRSGSLPSNLFTLRFAGASSDFTRVMFEADDVLTSATQFAPAPEDGGPESGSSGTSKHNLYEWTDGSLKLINVFPGNATTKAAAEIGSGKQLASTTESGPDFSHAVSDDGSRIFWTDTQSKRVYVRVDGERTLEIPDAGAFLTAAADGSRVLLSDGHMYDLGTSKLTDLTGGHGGFQGILGAGEDLSRVYFIDTEVLTGAEQNDEAGMAQTDKDNAYAYDAETGGIRFIATLSAKDNGVGVGEILGSWKASPSNRLAQVTADGRFLAFVSFQSLTGYDNTGVQGGASDSEVFEYDSASGGLVCVSCGPQGVRPTGGSRLGLIDPLQSIFPQPHDLAEDGRVFFDSRTVLSPHDVNGSVQDVYEYEPAGIGTCAQKTGCISLISAGSSSTDSEFVDATPSGSDAFFTTHSQLVVEDQDDLVDLYDARAGGGFPELTAPICTGTGCQGIPSAPPIFATPSSVTFEGVGNFAASTPVRARKATKKRAKRCPRSGKRRRGRCVPVHHAKKGKRMTAARKGHSTGRVK
ncbi:MAG TPA: hypothetical protein VK781_10985 [Solirubrobacteraceae bacterium]|jgi:DNA-binding beta-propeller fold protein YncE|nr:hypothetical protein [Solirubrobacteraceae bacterium]